MSGPTESPSPPDFQPVVYLLRVPLDHSFKPPPARQLPLNDPPFYHALLRARHTPHLLSTDNIALLNSTEIFAARDLLAATEYYGIQRAWGDSRARFTSPTDVDWSAKVTYLHAVGRMRQTEEVLRWLNRRMQVGGRL